VIPNDNHVVVRMLFVYLQGAPTPNVVAANLMSAGRIPRHLFTGK